MPNLPHTTEEPQNAEKPEVEINHDYMIVGVLIKYDNFVTSQETKYFYCKDILKVYNWIFEKNENNNEPDVLQFEVVDFVEIEKVYGEVKQDVNIVSVEIDGHRKKFANYKQIKPYVEKVSNSSFVSYFKLEKKFLPIEDMIILK